MHEQDTAPHEVEVADHGVSTGNARRCPHCGSDNVRLSSKQSQFRLVSRYRCRKCGRHFEAAAGHATQSPGHHHGGSSLKRRLIAGGVLLLVAIVAVAVIASMRGGDKKPEPVVSKAAATAPDAKGDAASAYERAMHFWHAAEYSESFNWFRNAANMGHGEAMYFLAKSYRQGRGTVQNYRYAFEYMKKASFKGVEKAQFELAYMYRDGIGTLEDQRSAYAWFNILGSRGNDEATIDRNRLATLMAPSDVDAGQELSLKLIEELKNSVMAVGDDDAQSGLGMQMPQGLAAPDDAFAPAPDAMSPPAKPPGPAPAPKP